MKDFLLLVAFFNQNEFSSVKTWPKTAEMMILQHLPSGAVRVLLEGKANPNTADKPMDETPLMEVGGYDGYGGVRRMTANDPPENLDLRIRILAFFTMEITTICGCFFCWCSENHQKKQIQDKEFPSIG